MADMIHIGDYALFLLCFVGGLATLAWGLLGRKAVPNAVRFAAACFLLALFFYIRMLPPLG